MGLTTDQIEFLQKLLNGFDIAKESDDLAANPTAPMAQKGNRPLSLTARRMNRSYWVVDTGASDHMTGSTAIFEKFQIREGFNRIDGRWYGILSQGKR